MLGSPPDDSRKPVARKGEARKASCASLSLGSADTRIIRTSTDPDDEAVHPQAVELLDFLQEKEGSQVCWECFQKIYFSWNPAF